MYFPGLKYKPNKVPVVSSSELEMIGENIIREFQPRILKYPQAVDVDRLAECYYNLDMQYQYLSNNGCYLGMMVFDDIYELPVFDPEKNDVNYISVNKDTILVDSSLLEADQKRRYKFTVAHEVSHKVLHSKYFEYNKGFRLCRTADFDIKRNQLITDEDWMEWQANRLASFILVPRSALVEACKHCFRYNLDVNMQGPEIIYELSKIFNVSVQAMEMRMKDISLKKWFEDFRKNKIFS